MARKIISSLYDTEGGFLSKYKRLRVGDAGWLTFFAFELVTTLFANLPGALGLFLRSKLYRPFFAAIGRGVVFGSGVAIRNPGRIRIGSNVIIDDYCVLDAKGEEPHVGIIIGDRVFLSRNTVLACKNGRIELGSGISIGLNSAIHSVDEGAVRIGDDVVIAAFTYIVAAPDYKSDRLDIPMAKQGFETAKGIRIGNDVWIGSAVVVLDGASIGEGSIIGAKALVRGEIPPYAKAVGVPAVVKGFRASGDVVGG